MANLSQVPPEIIESQTGGESFDFGSCVALHRFLYDHWDHVRQRLVSQERKDFVRSPAESSRGRSPVLEPLRNLITNLGPPQLAVTWNRPLISANTPPAYSRFQNFMLRNAHRGTESFLTARAVYDGGESKVQSLHILCSGAGSNSWTGRSLYHLCHPSTHYHGLHGLRYLDLLLSEGEISKSLSGIMDS